MILPYSLPQAGERLERVARLLAGRMFELVVATMILAIFLGLRYQGFFRLLKPLTPLLVFMMLLQPAFALQLGGLKSRLARKSVFIAAILVLYVVAYPLLLKPFIDAAGMLLPRSLYGLLVGGVLVALAPVAMPAPAIVSINGGDAELSLMSVVVTFLAAPFVMPLYSQLLLHKLVSLDALVIIKSVVIFIGGALLVGQSIRIIIYRLGGRGVDAARVARSTTLLLTIISCISLYMLVAIVTGCAAKALVANTTALAYFALILLAYDTLRYLLGFLAGRLLRAACPETLALVAVGSENGALGMALATPLGDLPAAGAVIAGPLLVLPTLTLFARLFSCSSRELG